MTPKVSTLCTVHCTLYTCTHSTQQFHPLRLQETQLTLKQVFAAFSLLVSVRVRIRVLTVAFQRLQTVLPANFRRFSPFFRAKRPFSRRFTPKQSKRAKVFSLFSCFCSLGSGSALFNRSFQIASSVPNIVLCVFMRADLCGPATGSERARSPVSQRAHRSTNTHRTSDSRLGPYFPVLVSVLDRVNTLYLYLTTTVCNTPYWSNFCT